MDLNAYSSLAGRSVYDHTPSMRGLVAYTNQSHGQTKRDYAIPSLLESRVHELVNDEREKHGLRPLSYDQQLADIALEHSADMADNDFFDHVNKKGENPSDRAARRGYDPMKSFGSYYTTGLGENLCLNHLYDTVTYVGGVPHYSWKDLDEIARSTLDGWMKSPGHRKNILTTMYDRQGIGVKVNGNKVLITENLN